jgi:RimJ/RimL family protein N-acetyltransferase
MKVLETERLTLRWFDERDAAFILALVNDPAWILNIGDRGLRTADAARAWIADKLVAAYWQKGHGLWAMERRADGALVGMCGLIERDHLPAIDVGYALAAPFRGQGYAREGAGACLRYARDALGARRVLAIVRPGNAESFRVLERIGMTAEGERVLEGEQNPTAVFAWDAPGAPQATDDARAQIDALVHRFFRAFSNRTGIAPVASVPSMLTPEAVITVARPQQPRAYEATSVRDFVLPRAELLLGGRLSDFEEAEVASETQIDGALARRSSRYRKAGTLDGAAFQGGGRKHFQLVRTRRGWKIAALAWEDDA